MGIKVGGNYNTSAKIFFCRVSCRLLSEINYQVRRTTTMTTGEWKSRMKSSSESFGKDHEKMDGTRKAGGQMLLTGQKEKETV